MIEFQIGWGLFSGLLVLYLKEGIEIRLSFYHIFKLSLVTLIRYLIFNDLVNLCITLLGYRFLCL